MYNGRTGWTIATIRMKRIYILDNYWNFRSNHETVFVLIRNKKNTSMLTMNHTLFRQVSLY